MNDRRWHVRLKLVVASLSFALVVLSGQHAAVADEAAQPPAKPGAKPGVRSSRESSGAKRPVTPTSLDEQLLQDLDNDLLPAGDDVPRQRPGEGADKAADGGDSKKREEGAEAGDAGEDLGQGGEQDPLSRIGDKMREAEGLIERKKSPQATEKLQEQIVSDLAKLIDHLQKQSQQQKSSSKKEQQTAQREQIKQPKSTPGDPNEDPQGGNPRPARDSTDQLRKNESRRPDMDAMNELMKDVWGQLPEHDREQMSQNAFEQFLPKYELLIEKYYKRLAEQQKERP